MKTSPRYFPCQWRPDLSHQSTHDLGRLERSRCRMTGPGVTEAIRTDIPDFEQVTRFLYVGEQLMRVTVDNDVMHFNELKYFVARSNFFKVFSFPFLKGDPITALKETNSMVITASTAKRYFGDADPIGKLI